MQKLAARVGAAPKIYFYYIPPPGDVSNKLIVMEKLDETLVDTIKRNNDSLPDKYQTQIINQYLNLDTAGVYHNDFNPLNLMLDRQTDQFKIIDYGMAVPLQNTSNVTLIGQLLTNPFQSILQYIENKEARVLQTYWNKVSKSGRQTRIPVDQVHPQSDNLQSEEAQKEKTWINSLWSYLGYDSSSESETDREGVPSDTDSDEWSE